MFSGTFIAICALSFVIIMLLIHAFILERRIKNMMRGKAGKSLEDVIVDLQNRVYNNEVFISKNSEDIKDLFGKMRKRIRNVSTLRFKPFEDAGSTQSFAIAIVNDDGDGVVLSSLYTRERMSVFAKPVTGNKSEYELTNEEKSVLESAKREA